MRLLMSTYDSCEGCRTAGETRRAVAGPRVGVRVCGPSDRAERLAGLGVPLAGRAQDDLTPETGVQATAVAGWIRTDRGGGREAATRWGLMR